MVLNMARMGVPLKGVVSFHGSLMAVQPAQKGKVKSRILVFNGEADPMVKPDDVKAFNHEMKKAGVKSEVVNYPGAKHAFTNPEADKFAKEFDLPLGYDQKADEDSWKKMQSFFHSVL